MRAHIVFVSVVLILAACLGCSAGNEPDGAVRLHNALIVPVSVSPVSGVSTTSAIRIMAPDKLVELEAFFPNYHKRPSSDEVSGWIAGYEVYFNFPGGETVLVTVSWE